MVKSIFDGVVMALGAIHFHLPGGTYQIPAFLLYTPRHRPGGTAILPVAGWTGFTELNGGFLSCVDLSTGSEGIHARRDKDWK